MDRGQDSHSAAHRRFGEGSDLHYDVTASFSGMERDLAAIQAKLDSIDKETEKIGVEHP